jgi:hypothetical protein
VVVAARQLEALAVPAVAVVEVPTSLREPQEPPILVAAVAAVASTSLPVQAQAATVEVHSLG